MQSCARGRHCGRRKLGRCDRHPCTCFHQSLMAEFTKSGIRSVRSTTSVPHFTNAIALDQLLSDALRSELAAARSGEKSS